MRPAAYTKPLARIFLIGLAVVLAEKILGGIKDEHMKALRL